MGFSKALLTMTLFFAFSAGANPAPWICGVNARLIGEASHFFLHGRDLWMGHGTMDCKSGNQKTSKTVDVAFRSRNEGFGADKKSVLQLALVMMSDVEPQSVVENTVANDQIHYGLLTYRIENQNREIVADILTQDYPAVMRSLRAGIISVRQPPPGLRQND